MATTRLLANYQPFPFALTETRLRFDLAPVATRVEAELGGIDILINNATQTVRRSPGAYQPLVDAELAPLPTADREILVAAVQILGRLIRAGEPVGGPQ